MSPTQELVKCRSEEKKKLLQAPWRQVTKPISMDEQIQAYCTCGMCICGYISPRIKWLLTHYASIYNDLLPRTISIFDDVEDSPLLNDLDAFDDLSHMPISLRRSMQGNIKLVYGYCDLFKAIVKGLNEEKEPNPKALENHIVYNWDGDYRHANLFFEAGGLPEHALQYLLGTLKRISLVRNSSATLEAKLGHIPRCLNDTGYDMVAYKLLKPSAEIVDIYTHLFKKDTPMLKPGAAHK